MINERMKELAGITESNYSKAFKLAQQVAGRLELGDKTRWTASAYDEEVAGYVGIVRNKKGVIHSIQFDDSGSRVTVFTYLRGRTDIKPTNVSGWIRADAAEIVKNLPK